MTDEERDQVYEYFLAYFPQRSWMCQETMVDGFIGLLDGIAWEEFQWKD